MTPPPLVSVIVPAFQDREALRTCLGALHEQTLDRGRYEVIVVDNGSSPPLADVCAAFAGVRCILEERPGSYAARNRGLAEARGEVLAFTDADCVPTRDWLANGVAAWNRAATRGAAFVAGRIDLFFADEGRPAPWESYELATGFQQAHYVRRHRSGATANLFTSPRVVERAGPFDADLRSGGDTEWGQRASRVVGDGVYADDVVVRHPSRATLDALLGKARRLVGGHAGRRGMQRRALLRAYLRWGLLKPLRSAVLVVRDPRLSARQKFDALPVVLRVAAAQVDEQTRLARGAPPRR